MENKTQRPSWDDFWFTLALMYSTRGTCDRLRTATIVVKNKRLVSAGYNGSPAGTEHCDEVGHLLIDGHCERTLHGEANAIISAERSSLEGATVYILGSPCLRCLKELIGAGIKTINCLGTYSNALGKEYVEKMTKETGVAINFHNKNPRELLNHAIKRLEDKGGALFTPQGD